MVLIDVSSVSCAQPRGDIPATGRRRERKKGGGAGPAWGERDARRGGDVGDDVAWARHREYSRLLGCDRRPHTRFTFALVLSSPSFGSVPPSGLNRQQRRDDVRQTK
jgi:hypothetical protein